MIRGLYTAASGLITKQIQQENLSNNIANINTPGFKNDKVLLKSFEDHLIYKREETASGRTYKRVVGSLKFGVGIDETKTDYSQGILEETGRCLDFALNGDGFFTVLDDKGQELYTRDGRFKINNDGILVNSQGYPVLVTIDGSNVKQTLKLNNSNVKLDENGYISNENTMNNSKIKFAIAGFNNRNDLIKQGDNTYLVKNAAVEMDNNTSVKQGYLEKSNIDTIETITQMITIMRSFESNQRVMQQMDETLGKTVNEVGNIR